MQQIISKNKDDVPVVLPMSCFVASIESTKKADHILEIPCLGVFRDYFHE